MSTRAKSDLAAVNDAITLDIDSSYTGRFSLQYPTGGTGTILIEATLNETTWEVVTFIKSTDTAQAHVASAAAVGLYTGDIPPCTKMRARKSAGVGACICWLAIDDDI